MAFKMVVITSRSEKNKLRHVRFTDNGIRCDCPAFVFNDKKECWHIREAKKGKN